MNIRKKILLSVLSLSFFASVPLMASQGPDTAQNNDSWYYSAAKSVGAFALQYPFVPEMIINCMIPTCPVRLGIATINSHKLVSYATAAVSVGYLKGKSNIVPSLLFKKVAEDLFLGISDIGFNYTPGWIQKSSKIKWLAEMVAKVGIGMFLAGKPAQSNP